MALDLDNFPYHESAKAGFEFERQVRRYLRESMPDDYVFRGGILMWDGGYGKEVDFLMAGPRGVIIIEAKFIKDAVMGDFQDENWLCTAPGTEDWNIKRPVEIINRKRSELKKRLETKINSLGSRSAVYRPYTEPLAVFVFSDCARIDRRITVCNTSPYHRVTHLKNLASVIKGWHINRGGPTLPLERENAKKILGWLRRTNLSPAPAMIGPYKIKSLNKGSRRLLDNGLIYTLCLLEETELDKKLRGKLYELPEDKNFDLELLLPQLRRHASVISELNHPNIHRYYAFLRSASGREFWVVEENIEGDTLEILLRGRTLTDLATVRKIMRGVAAGLQALHAKGIVHRELTPEAILVERGTKRAIITNFELAKLSGDPHTVALDHLRHNPYRATEVEVDPHNVDQKDDIYSWGAILYHLLTQEEYQGTFPNLGRFPKELHSDLAVAEWCLVPPRSERPSNFGDIFNAPGWSG
jgi:serine/threonine protein kinase